MEKYLDGEGRPRALRWKEPAPHHGPGGGRTIRPRIMIEPESTSYASINTAFFAFRCFASTPLLLRVEGMRTGFPLNIW